jgi:hypothetical protein
MPVRDWWISRVTIGIGHGAVRVVVAVGRFCSAVFLGFFGGLWHICRRCGALIATTCATVARLVIHFCVALAYLVLAQIRRGLAWGHRWGPATIVLVGVTTIPVSCWLFRTELSAGLHDLLALQGTDTAHATWYYAVNVIFLPLQTALLIIGGVYAWLTLRQSARFKQHDAEARCVSDYIAVEQKMHAAKTEADMKAAARAYWTLIIYEYHWWRRGLISRELFTVWMAFHMQKFGPNAPVYTNFQAWNLLRSFNFAKRNKVFRTPSSFAQLMGYLIGRARAADGADLKWHHIERFRHGWGPHF